jgi:hypothetical protein
MEPADGRLVELDVPVRRSILATESHFCRCRTGLTDEPDFLPELATLDYLESTREELEGSIHGTKRTPAGGFPL